MTKETFVEGMWAEPEADFKAKYPFNKVMETESGHLFEFDDTPGSERVRLQHRIGTYTELQSDGARVTHVVGDDFEVVVGDKNVSITGKCSITITGDCEMAVLGDFTQRIYGNHRQIIEGTSETVVKGLAQHSYTGDVEIITGATGTYTVQTSLFDITGDLDVDQSIMGESITSRGQISATTGIAVGLTASGNPAAATAGITTLGGITVGSPQQLSLPGQITALAPYDSVKAPDIHGLFAVRDSAGTMNLIRAIYNMHWHPTPKGPSGTPIAKMILM